MDVVVNEAVVELGAPQAKRSSSQVLLHGVLFVVTVAIVVIGLRTHVPNGITAVNAVAFGLTLVWAVAALVANRYSDRTAAGPDPYALLIARRFPPRRSGAHRRSAGSARDPAFLRSREVGRHDRRTVGDGRLVPLPAGSARRAVPGTGRRTAVVVGYVAALATGVSLVIDKHALSILGGGISWSIAAVVAVIPLRLRYAGAVGHDRERLQWFAIGVVLASAIALVMAVLHVLINWPGPLGAVAAGSTALVPISLMASESRRLAPQSGRMLVRSFTVFGFVAMVSAIYLVVVLGLGHKPNNSTDRTTLGLSMLATGIAALAFVPARERFVGSATRFVYGARQAPDEVLRTFGSRLTRAIPMDELLLQLAESLRKTMGLVSAEVYTGMGEVLERAVSVPDSGPLSLVVTGRERPVVTRAGVSGSAWVSVWLPALLDGRAAGAAPRGPHQPRRRAPRSGRRREGVGRRPLLRR